MIQTENSISAIKPDKELINKDKKKTCYLVDFTVPADHRVKIIFF